MARYLGEGAHHVTYGGMSRQPLTIPASLLIFRDLSFHGFWITQWNDRHSAHSRAAMLADVADLIRREQLVQTPLAEVSWPTESADVSKIVEAIGGSMEGFGGRKLVLKMI